MTHDNDSTTGRLVEIRARLDACDRGPHGAIGQTMEMFTWAGHDIEFLLSLVDSLRERLDTAEGLVADLVDSGKCGFDHNGHCQEHAWFETDPACPHGRAKALGLDNT